VLVEDEDLLGDGVNIASRLESICEPSGVTISSAAFEHVSGKVEVGFVDLGDQTLKNIAKPVRAYRVTFDQVALGSEPSSSDLLATQLAVSEKPSIAVLPFQNIGGDPEQEYFVEGMVEDIITALSRIKWVLVIARNSSSVYKGKSADVRQIGRELGARYLLEGSVRKAGERLRITAQLIEADTGAHLWADKFDGSLEDVFSFQDQITEKVVGIVGTKFEKDRDRAVAQEASRKSQCLRSLSALDKPSDYGTPFR
jgi:adenylate cyclase